MPQQESLVLKITTFLITENKLSFHSACAVETVFQGIPTVLSPKESSTSQKNVTLLTSMEGMIELEKLDFIN